MSGVPQNWTREMLKRRVRFAYGESLASENRNDGDVPVFGSNGVVGTHDRSITQAPAIVIGRKGSSGKVTWSDIPCLPIDTTYFVDRTQTREDMRWLFYALESLELDKINFDSAVPGLSRELAYSLPLFFPPLSDQQRIAAYLDTCCAAIDAAAAAKRHQIETLNCIRKATIQNVITKGLKPAAKMRSTGIPLLETIPAHWGADRLRDIAAINSISLAANTDPKYEFDYLEISNVNSHGIVDTNAIERICFEDAPSRARRCVTKNSTLISSVRPNLQAILFVSEHRQNFVCSTGFNVVQPNEAKLRPKFIYYALISDSGRQHFEATAKGVSYPAVDDKDFGAFVVPLPPLEEQDTICAHLDAKLGEIKRIVTGIDSQIFTLTSYRKSLIHECVTGQRRVTEADVARAHRGREAK